RRLLPRRGSLAGCAASGVGGASVSGETADPGGSSLEKRYATRGAGRAERPGAGLPLGRSYGAVQRPRKRRYESTARVRNSRVTSRRDPGLRVVRGESPRNVRVIFSGRAAVSSGGTRGFERECSVGSVMDGSFPGRWKCGIVEQSKGCKNRAS